MRSIKQVKIVTYISIRHIVLLGITHKTVTIVQYSHAQLHFICGGEACQDVKQLVGKLTNLGAVQPRSRSVHNRMLCGTLQAVQLVVFGQADQHEQLAQMTSSRQDKTVARSLTQLSADATYSFWYTMVTSR